MVLVADLFCGAGGTSTGLARAAEKLGVAVDLVAVNHWRVAVETHERNHPWARHVCADLGSVEADPNRLVPGGRLDLLVASPECTHFSAARGGRPGSDQSRASAWHVAHWCERLDVQELLVENVREFLSWGPLCSDGRPIKGCKGVTFRAWVGVLESLGYIVEWRLLNAADYGAATTRRRLFVRASKSGRVCWPEETHGEGRRRGWRPAREIIDWTLKGKSIRERKRPLAANTLRRIETGLRKFGGEAFIAVLRGAHESQRGSWARGVDEPLGTISCSGGHAALCEPFVLGQQSCAAPRSVNEPLPTIATAGAISVVQPFLTKYYGSGEGVRPVDEPLDTVTTRDRFALVEPVGMDIRFRMLQPHELAAAMGFDGYEFAGTKTEQVRQIGNAVAVPVAEALCREIIKGVCDG